MREFKLHHRLHPMEIAYRSMIGIFFVGFVLIVGVLQFDVLNEIGTNRTVLVYITLLIPAVLVVMLLHGFVIDLFLMRRAKKLWLVGHAFGLRKGSYLPLSPTIKDISEAAHMRLARNAYGNDDWSFCDIRFIRFRETNRGSFPSKTQYVSVAAFRLPRVLPNIFFDSKRTQGREFKLLFKSSQRHSLEGDFDTYFTTYFHEDYIIDNLSFITPDVMLDLIAACEYDIEIYGDTLYLYGDVMTMPKQLLDMQRVGFALQRRLSRSALTYRDERIDFDYGRKTVSTQGIRLRRSLSRAQVGIGFGIVLTAFGLFTISFDMLAGSFAALFGVALSVFSLIHLSELRRGERR